MKRVLASLITLSLLAGGSAFAQQQPQHDDHDRGGQQQHDRGNHGDNHGQQQRNDRQPPRKGGRLADDYRGDGVPDYRKHGLRKPPRGHEWRKVDGNYVLVAVATGIIASVIAANR